MDEHIKETLSLSPLYAAMTEDEKNLLIQEIISHHEYPPDNEKTATACINT